MTEDSDLIEKPSSGPSLDLGLQGIIDNAEKTLVDTATPQVNGDSHPVSLQSLINAAKDSEEKTVPRPESEPKSLPAVAEVDRPAFEELANKKQWKELGALCEKRLADTDDSDVEAKLWWVKSQYSLKAIPISILAPSLDQASRQFFNGSENLSQDAKKGRVAGLAVSLLCEFARHLQREEDFELALSFLERGYRVDPMLREDLKKTVRNQIAIIERDPDKFPAEHMQNLKRLGIELMLSSAPTIEKPSAGESSKTAVREKIAGNASSNPFKGKAKELVVGLATLALLLFLSFWAVDFAGNYFETQRVREQKLTAVMPIEIPRSQPEALAPFPAPLNGLTHLDAVYYDFHGKDAALQTAGSKAVQPPIAQLAGSSSGLPDTPLPVTQQPSSQDRDSLRRRETVNTNSPIIDPNFPRYEVEQPKQDSAIDFPPFRQKQPSAQLQNGREASATGASGSIGRYVVIARTKVMEEPSYYAYSPGDLYEGDEIHVDANLGKWLRIRTRKGRIAYVLAQDAVPL